jgi:hypothetical protein
MTKMKKGISYLIEKLENYNPKERFNIGDFAIEFLDVISNEPERLGELIEVYTKAFAKKNKSLQNHIVKKKVLENIAIQALLADGLVKKAEKENNPFVEGYYLYKKNYGPAMNAFSKYLGLEEKELVLKIFYPEKLN